MSVKVLITAGGTRDSIDDVRLSSHLGIEAAAGLVEVNHFDIDNFARGTFGYEIGRAFVARGAEVTLVGSRDLIRGIKQIPDGMQLVPFRSFADLQAALREQLPLVRPDFVLMSAAVADYSPVAVEGKLSSDLDEMVIRCRRNPKLLDELRGLAGPAAKLVGFKLLSGVSDEQLEAVARSQIGRAALDATVANDFRRIDWERGIHPILLVLKNGPARAISGRRPDVAAELVASLLDG